MPKLLSAICLAMVLPSVAHAQFSYDDFIRNVETNSTAASPGPASRVALTTAQENSLPAPSAESVRPAPSPQVPSLAAPAQAATPVPVPAKTAAPQPPVPAPSAVVPQPIPMAQSVPTPTTNSSNLVNFDQLFADEQYGLSAPANCGCGQGDSSMSGAGCGERTCRCSHCTTMAYYTPNLPAASSLRGYFNASPCIANLWDNYACEAGKECARIQQMAHPNQGAPGCR